MSEEICVLKNKLENKEDETNTILAPVQEAKKILKQKGVEST